MTRAARAFACAVAAGALVLLAGQPARSTHPPTQGGESLRCDACHTPGGWRPARFAHERTSYPLEGKHRTAPCVNCHTAGYDEPLPTACATCHVDPHQLEFGLQCKACHTPESFQPLFAVDAHRRTGFPLIGRHAVLPCEECHVQKRERTFTRVALDCQACHVRDAARARLTTVDHRVAPFSRASCGNCHAPTSFFGGRYAEHDRCFPISVGKHAPFTCAQCHAGLAGARANGNCNGPPARCAECHEHRADKTDGIHREVPGYLHASERCAACHHTAE